MRVVVRACRAERDAKIGGRISEIQSTIASRLTALGQRIGIPSNSAVGASHAKLLHRVSIGIIAARCLYVVAGAGEVVGPIAVIADCSADSVGGEVDGEVAEGTGLDARPAVDWDSVVAEGTKGHTEVVERIGVGIVGADGRADAHSCGGCVISVVADWASGDAELGQAEGVGLVGEIGADSHAQSIGMERVAVLIADLALLLAGAVQPITESGKRRCTAILHAGPLGLHVGEGVGDVGVAGVDALAGGVVLVAEHRVVADLHAHSRLPEGKASYAGGLAHLC